MDLEAFRVKQRGVTLYIGVMSAQDLIERHAVDVWRPTNAEGYQRDLAASRVKGAAHYVTAGDGVFPTTVLLSYRKAARFKKASTDDSADFGTLRLDNDEELWAIDGQHRIAGLARAIEEGHRELLEYPVPVAILVDADRYTEMRWFYIVNSRQKRVPVDLAERLLVQAINEAGEDHILDHESPNPRQNEQLVSKARVVGVVDELMDICPVWKGRVYRPGEAKPHKEAVKAHTIITSLMRGAMRDPSVEKLAGKQPESLARVLHHYWCAIAERFPEAIAGGDDYSIRRTQGLYGFHMVFPDVLELCREQRDYSQETMREILEHLEEGDDFWSRDEDLGDPLTSSTSMASLRRLARHLRKQLPQPVLPGL